MRRMTSRGVKCSPAVSLESSANLRINSSKMVPMSALLTLSRVQVDLAELFCDKVEQIGVGESVDLRLQLEAGEDVFDVGRKAMEIGRKVHRDVILVANDGL